MNAYSSFASVYDKFMDNVPYEEWADYVTGILHDYGIDDGLILDLGCGSGNITELLAQKGYDMIGVDLSEDMLSIANEKKIRSGHDILYLCQDMRQFELYGTVRAVVSLCDCLNYITDEDDLLKVFKLVANYLDYDGLFIFDMNTPYKYEELLADNTFAENREDAAFIWENYYDRESRINEYDLTLFIENADGSFKRFEEVHEQRSYEIGTVKSLLIKAGLEIMFVRFDTDNSGDEETDLPKTDEDAAGNSQRVYFVARKNAPGTQIR